MNYTIRKRHLALCYTKFMKYFILFIPLFFYFELLGRAILLKFNRKPFDISFSIGMVFTMAILYVIGWPISSLDMPSIYYVFLLCSYFLISLFFIIKNIKKIDYSFDYRYLIVFLILLAFEIFESYNRTLADPHGFDIVFYVNYIGYNVDTAALNSVQPLFGTFPNTHPQAITYVFQSYNYFISSYIYIAQKLFGLLHVSLDFLPSYVWTFQILLHCMFISVSLSSIKELKIKNKIMQISFVVLLVLFLNNLYYNNSFGFLGNSYRMSIHALATIFLFRYFDSKEHNDLFIFLTCMLGLCGFSSTGTFAFVFVLFALFFYLYDKENNLIKYYSLFLFMPVLNILCVKLGIKWYVVVFTLLVFIILYFLNDLILKIYKNKYIRYGTIALVALFLIVMSVRITHNLFDFYGFTYNYSERQDMSWDYFDFFNYRHWIFNPIVLVPLFYHLFKNRKHPFSIVCIVLILSIFNPFGATYMNKINWVYYRTYDIIINQFTLVYFINYLYENIRKKQIVSYILLAASIVLAVTQIPQYYHESFKPSDDYNYIYKIDNSELEMINNVRNLIKDKGIERPRIINSTFFMNSFIKNGEYLIGKEIKYDYAAYNDLTYDLYLIFYPPNGWDNFRPTDPPKYDEVIELLKQSDFDIVIVDNGLFIDYKGEYMPLAEAVCSDGTYTKSEYSTAKYAVIYLH